MKNKMISQRRWIGKDLTAARYETERKGERERGREGESEGGRGELNEKIDSLLVLDPTGTWVVIGRTR